MILVGKDKIYAPPVRQLRLLGIPTWLIVPGRLPAASLYRAACAVSFIGPASAWPEPDAAGEDRAALPVVHAFGRGGYQSGDRFPAVPACCSPPRGARPPSVAGRPLQAASGQFRPRHPPFVL